MIVVHSFFFALCLVLVLSQSPPFSTNPPWFNKTTHQMQPPEILSLLDGPLPTSSFSNLYFPPETNLIDAYPFHLQLSNFLSVCYPEFYRFFPNERHLIRECADPLGRNSNWKIGAVEYENMPFGWKIANYTLLSLNLQWTDGPRNLTVPVVYGSPYVTLLYQFLTPKLQFSTPIMEINGITTFPISITSPTFVIVLSSGEHVMLLASSSLTLSWSDSYTLTANAVFSGYIRACYPNTSADQAVFFNYRQRYPISGSVGYSFPSSEEIDIHFNWTANGAGELLMLALPHHLDILEDPELTLHDRYSSLRGNMTGVVGDHWKMKETVPSITWESPRNILDAEPIREALYKEDYSDHAHFQVYEFGKDISSLARLALIAEEIHEENLRLDLIELLHERLSVWLSGQNPNFLVYDTTWGGIITSVGATNPGIDYGNGWYNDHDAQYGYLVYAIAVAVKYDPSFLTEFHDQIYDLIRDFANPSIDDPFYPQFRHFDFYSSQTWASGLDAFSSGKNQESTSESVNAYYALRLLGMAMGDENVENVGSLLLAMMIRGTQKYFHMKSSDPIYPPEFAKHKLYGILWSNKADAVTFFGDDMNLVHLVQFLPITPITESLFTEDFCEEQYQVIADLPPPPGWCALKISNYAIIDPADALTQVDSCTNSQLGDTITNLLYWIYTRPIE